MLKGCKIYFNGKSMVFIVIFADKVILMQRKLLPFLFFLFLTGFLHTYAQQYSFIYIQAENKQPFYVKIDKKIFSSSASGYVIIPKLLDADYTLYVGFPKNEWNEQHFNCKIAKKDLGFLLKNFAEKGWGLFNIQTMEMLMDGSNSPVKKQTVQQEETDGFSSKLSKVVNDPTLNQVESTSVASTEPATETPAVKPTIKKEKGKVKHVATVTEPAKEKAIRSVVSRESVNSNADGTALVYVDVANGNIDTIKVFIPAEKVETPVETVKEAVVEKTTKPVEPVVENPQPAIQPQTDANKVDNVTDKKFLEVDLSKPKNEVKPVTQQVQDTVNKEASIAVTESKTQQKQSSTQMVNSNCKGISTEDDFLKLRKKMASANSDEEMVNTARKAFKSKCYSTQQIRNLAVLFLSDAGKYQFFDAAYPFVSDSSNFPNLETLLTDSYYINRFKVMINH
jgi:hypothetical protein